MYKSNKPEYCKLVKFLKEYSERNINNDYRPVAVGRYGIRSRESIYSKELAKDYSKNKLIYKDTLTVGMGSVQIDIGVLMNDVVFSVSPAYHTYKISNINSAYLDYCLQCRNQDMFQRYVKRGSRQGKSIDLKRWLEYEIPVYDRDFQLEIVDRLDKTKNIINLYKQELQKLDELIKARFVEMFGNPIVNDNKWPIQKLKNITLKIGSGATPKGGKESYVSKGISLIRSMNVHDSYFEYKDLAHITNKQAEKLKNVIVDENDVLFNITGASVARTCVVPNDVLPARVNQHVAIIRCNKEMIDPIFLNRMLNNEFCKNALLNIGESGGATRQAITKEELESFEVIIPPINEQNKFAEFAKQIDKSKFLVQKSLDEAQLLFDSLMQKYFG